MDYSNIRKPLWHLVHFTKVNFNNILICLFVLSIFFRLFSIIVVPEPAYNDSVYHLELAKSFMGGFELTKDTPPFLYHLIVALFFSVTGLPMIWPFVKVIPLLVFALSTIIALLFFKKIFPKTYLLPTIFFTVFPWAVRIGSVNMVDSFSILVVLLFTYFLYLLVIERNEKRMFFLSFLCSVSFVLISFSKTNVLFLSPALILGYLFFSYKKIGLKKTVPLFVLALLLNFSFIFLSINSPAISDSAATIRSLPLPELDLIQPMFFLKSIPSFFDFPHESAISKVPLLNSNNYLLTLVIFTLLLSPLFLAILFESFVCARFVFSNIKIALKKMSVVVLTNWFFVFCLLALFFSVYPSTIIIRESEPYIRYLLPGLVFFALLLGKLVEDQFSLWKINQENKSKKSLANGVIVVLILFSLVVLCLYSFAMTSTSAVFYHNIEEKNMPLYEFVKSSNEITSVISLHNARAIRYYTGKETIVPLIPKEGIYSIDDLNREYSKFTPYIAIGCYNEDMLTAVSNVTDNSKVDIIFENGCTKLLKMK